MTKPTRKKAGPEPADDLAGLLKRLDAWLKKNRKNYWKGLNAGATAKDLSALEKELGFAVPDDLAALLRWHNGQDDDTPGAFVDEWRLMSAEQIATAKHDLDGAGEKAWRDGFVPFLENDRGDCVVVDTKSSGQPMRVFWGGKAEAEVAAPSLRAWLEQFVTDVEAGNYVEEPERGGFFKKGS